MKAQFKYAFLTGFSARGPVFAVTAIFMLVFGVLGSLNLLPFAAHITGVAIGGVAIAVMLAANIIGDVQIARRMFSAPDAYLAALTPVPRGKTLLASVITMMALDTVTMAAVITGEVWLSFNFTGIGDVLVDAFRYTLDWTHLRHILYLILLGFAGYLLGILVILFCVAARKSFLYKVRASRLLTFLLACGCFYAISLLNVLMMPFGSVWRYGLYFNISLSGDMLPLYILLTLLEAAGFFVLTAKLMERKMNI